MEVAGDAVTVLANDIAAPGSVLGEGVEREAGGVAGGCGEGAEPSCEGVLGVAGRGEAAGAAGRWDPLPSASLVAPCATCERCVCAPDDGGGGRGWTVPLGVLVDTGVPEGRTAAEAGRCMVAMPGETPCGRCAPGEATCP